MQQSNAIFAALIIAWIVFITIRGELSQYLELLKGNGAPSGAAAGNGIAGPGGVLDVGQGLLNGALKAFGF